MVDEEEVFGDEIVGDEETEQGPGALKKLREKLQKAIEEKQEYLDGWQRARADFANYKKEEASMHSDREERMKAHFIEKLLPALDTVELSLKHDPSDSVKMIEKQFIDALKKLGIEQFGHKGDPFDPHLHEALAHEHEGTNIERVERSGYKIGTYIIRPAQVII